MHIFQCMGKIFCVEFQRVPQVPPMTTKLALWQLSVFRVGEDTYTEIAKYHKIILAIIQ